MALILIELPTKEEEERYRMVRSVDEDDNGNVLVRFETIDRLPPRPILTIDDVGMLD
jgi:hypothetical protein